MSSLVFIAVDVVGDPRETETYLFEVPNYSYFAVMSNESLGKEVVESIRAYACTGTRTNALT